MCLPSIQKIGPICDADFFPTLLKHHLSDVKTNSLESTTLLANPKRLYSSATLTDMESTPPSKGRAGCGAVSGVEATQLAVVLTVGVT